MKNLNVENKFKYSIDPIDIDKTKIIIKQMKHCICKIKNGDKKCSGFLCNINVNEKSRIRGLFTSYDIINDNDIKEKKSIELFFNNGKEYNLFKLDDNRKIISDINFGIRIFIIQNDDNLNNEKNYLDLDDDLFKTNISYKDKSIYILQNPKDKKALIIFSKIKEIQESKITHRCQVDNNAEGSPILNLTNNKVIGIQNVNHGLFLKSIIQELINRKMKLNNNEVKDIINKNHIFVQKGDSFIILKKEKCLYQEDYIDSILIGGFEKSENEIQNVEIFCIINSYSKHSKIKNKIEKQNEVTLLGKKKNNILNISPQKKKFIYQQNNNINNLEINNNIELRNVNPVPNNIVNNMMNNNNNFMIPVQNNIGFNMINNNHNNIGFNMMNNNLNNNFNQINIINNNNAQNIDKNISINEKYLNKLCKNSKRKINVTFTYRERKTFIVDFGTSIHELLINYLKYMGMFYISDYITFVYNASRLNINDQTPIEKVSSYSVDMRIIINISDMIVLKNFNFESASGIKLKLVFDNYSTIEELLQAFFEEVEKPELFGKDDKINFLYNAHKIKYKDKEIIDATFNEHDSRIVVLDTNNLLTSN
jgi:hypothetical protein